VATKLNKEVARELIKTQFMGVPLVVTLVPATETLPERLRFSLKGKQKGGRELTLKWLYALSERSDAK
jgi:hypothetical protein